MENKPEIIENGSRNALSVCAGFAIGFILGAAVVAIIDYYVDKKDQLKKLKRDTDENYITS